MSKTRDKANTPQTNFSSTGIDDNATSTAVTLDSSGNVLIGNSTGASNVEGIALRKGSTTNIVRDGGGALLVNRLTDDGDIVLFYKDTTKVGSIGVDNSDNLFISGNSTHAGFEFGSSSIVAYKNGTSPDNAISLGGGAQRFANLYLGGSVYLGGTTSANALDDYEEGTWTPTYGGSTTNPTVTYGFQGGNYTKIGRMVIAQCLIRGQATAQGSGVLIIEGLPFAAKSTSGYQGTGSIGYSINWNADNAPALCVVESGASYILLRTYSSDDPRDGASTTIDAGDLNTSSTTSNYTILSVAYETA